MTKANINNVKRFLNIVVKQIMYIARSNNINICNIIFENRTQPTA